MRLVAPLTDLLTLANTPVLVAPNFQKHFLLAVDASACGAVLLHVYGVYFFPFF